MSNEQSEKGEITQQATTLTPTSTPKREKNPKRVAAGKLVAERTRLAREQQRKAAAEAAVIIANNKTKASNTVAEPDQLIRLQKTKHQRVKKKKIAFSAPPNGLLL